MTFESQLSSYGTRTAVSETNETDEQPVSTEYSATGYSSYEDWLTRTRDIKIVGLFNLGTNGSKTLEEVLIRSQLS